MTRAEIREVFQSFGCFHIEEDLHGFTMGPDANLRPGGGIATNQNQWWLRWRGLGGGLGPSRTWRVIGPASTKTALRRIVREWLTNEDRPEERNGYTLYAKLNHNSYGDHYVWCYRRR